MNEEKRDYLAEEQSYRSGLATGGKYRKHRPDEACSSDLAYLFSWESFPKRGSTVLELGCGDGFVSRKLAKTGLLVYGVDCSPTAVRQARKNFDEDNLQGVFEVGDVLNLAMFETGKFQFILDSHCLHCVCDYGQRAQFLRECRRLLRPGGRLFIAGMGQQPMDWFDKEANARKGSQLTVDEKGCYRISRAMPGSGLFVHQRIFISEELLRAEVKAAGFVVHRLENYHDPASPGSVDLLAELG